MEPGIERPELDTDRSPWIIADVKKSVIYYRVLSCGAYKQQFEFNTVYRL